jgi:hypothetical protein
MTPKNVFALLAALSLGISAAPAGLLTYVTQPSFVADLPAGYYLNNFSVLPPGVSQNDFVAPYHNVGFTNGSPPVGYQIDAAGGDFFTDYPIDCASTWQEADTLTVTFTTGNVLAVGANFFLADFNGNPTPGLLTVRVNFADGSGVTNTVTSTASPTVFGFFGLSSDTPIVSLSVAAASQYVTLGNLYVSANAAVASTTVSVAATGRNAWQSGLTNGVFTITRTNLNNDYSAALPVSFVLGGTATNGLYTCSPAGITPATTNTVTLQAGRLSTNLTIQAVLNNTPHPSTFVLLTLTRGNGYATNAPAAAVAVQGTGPQTLAISSIAPAGTNVVLNFASGEFTDGASAFAVQSSSSVGGTYVDVSPPAAIIPAGLGSFQATVPMSGNALFYRLRHL